MKQILIVLLFVLSANKVSSQQIKLNGQISIHNSKYNTGKIQYVENASIIAPFTKPSSSDREGKFSLEFVGIESGTSISLNIEKSGFQVVNQYDLSDVTLGRKNKLLIYLANKGQLASAQTELYNISKQALFQQKDAIIAQLKKENNKNSDLLKELEKQFGTKLADRFQAEEVLNQKYNELRKQLPKYALELAQQNLDYASEQFITAYELYKKGNIEAAIKTLDSSKINKLYIDAKASISKGKTIKRKGDKLIEKGYLQIQQVVDLKQLKVNNLLLKFRYAEAIKVYESLIKIYKDNEFDRLKLAKAYDFLAAINFDAGNYKSAHKYQLDAISIKEEIFKTENTSLATSYNWLATIQVNIDDFENALKNCLKAIKIQEKILDPNDKKLAVTYNNAGGIYRTLGEFEKALDYLNKAISIDEINNNKEVAYSYNRKGLLLRDLGRYQEALNYQKKSLTLFKDFYGENHKVTAMSYNNVADALKYLHREDEAITFQEKAIAIYESILEPSHPELGVMLFNLGATFKQQGKFDLALKYIEKGLTIFESQLGLNHSNTATAYGFLAEVQTALGDITSAIENQKKSLEIREQIFEEPHHLIAMSNFALGVIYSKANDLENALVYQKKGLDQRKKSLGDTHHETGISHFFLSSLYSQKGDYRLAIKHMEKTAEINTLNLGNEHPFVASDYMSLAQLFVTLNNKNKALEWRQKAKEVIDRITSDQKTALETDLKRLDTNISQIKK